MSAAQSRPRTAGILLHVTSLPGPHATGDLGAVARAFVDFLADAGQQVWQVLPIHPAGEGNSPYSGASAFAGDPMLVSLADLVEEGWLDARELPAAIAADRTDHAAARAVREPVLRRAFSRFRPGREYERFERDAASWLADYALYTALARRHGARRSRSTTSSVRTSRSGSRPPMTSWAWSSSLPPIARAGYRRRRSSSTTPSLAR